MAFRIHESVIRGEIDNRVKGVVTGRIWIYGREEPVVLELQGNAHPDLAGCMLKFSNPLKIVPHHHLESLNLMQRGAAGDLTASRKVRVYDIPVAEAFMMSKRGEKPPEHMANCLYLEWFSEHNGRVVVESPDYVLEISAPEWRLTPEEDRQRALDAASGMDAFMKKLTDAIDAERAEKPDAYGKWDEFDHERAFRESDAMTDKYMELLDKYGDTPEAEAMIAKEMGWGEGEEEENDEAEENEVDEESGEPLTVEEINRITEEAAEHSPELDQSTKGLDWIETKRGTKHPLSHRALESVLALIHTVDELGLEESEDTDLQVFVGEFQITSAKLAGALDSLCYGRDTREGAFIVAYLKRGLGHLHKSQAGLEKVAEKKLLPAELVEKHRKELFEIREGILALMTEFRGES